MIFLKQNKKTKFPIIIVLVVFVLLLRLPSFLHADKYYYVKRDLVRVGIYTSLIILWGSSIERRIIQTEILKILKIINYLMVFWFLARTARYTFTYLEQDISRWLWYLYYIPLILIPFFNIFISISLGKKEDYKLPFLIKLLIIPSLLLILIVLTNDYHQLVFRFPKNDLFWTSNNYIYGSFYWLIFLWIIVSYLLSILFTIKNSRVPIQKNKVYLPLIPYFVGLLYGLLYIIKINLSLSFSTDMTEVFIFLNICTYELLIKNGLIKSNMHYEDLFYASNLKAKIIDTKGQLYYETNSGLEKDSVNYRTLSNPIKGGQVIWQEDISEIRKLILDLEEINARLNEKNNLLQAELDLKERKIKLEENIRLYQKINSIVRPKMLKLNELLVNEANISNGIIGIIGTYLKRKINLLVLQEESETINIQELNYAFFESIEAISNAGIYSTYKNEDSIKIDVSTAIILYDLFEEIIELNYFELSDIFINLIKNEEFLNLKIHTNIEVYESMENNIVKLQTLIKDKGKIKFIKEDDICIIDVKVGDLNV